MNLPRLYFTTSPAVYCKLSGPSGCQIKPPTEKSELASFYNSRLKGKYSNNFQTPINDSCTSPNYSCFHSTFKGFIASSTNLPKSLRLTSRATGHHCAQMDDVGVSMSDSQPHLHKFIATTAWALSPTSAASSSASQSFSSIFRDPFQDRSSPSSSAATIYNTEDICPFSKS
jgi:hypothetical protein